MKKPKINVNLPSKGKKRKRQRLDSNRSSDRSDARDVAFYLSDDVRRWFTGKSNITRKKPYLF